MGVDLGQPHRFAIDRIEDGWATLELQAGVTFSFPAAWLPAEAAEGQVLLVATRTNDRASTLTFSIDEADTEQTRDRVRSKLDRLRGRE